jgi:hypothetical protein
METVKLTMSHGEQEQGSMPNAPVSPQPGSGIDPLFHCSLLIDPPGYYKFSLENFPFLLHSGMS